MMEYGNLALVQEEEIVYNDEANKMNVDEIKIAYEKQMELLFGIAENTKDSNVRYMVDRQMTSLNEIYMELTGGEDNCTTNETGENKPSEYDNFLNGEDGDALTRAYKEDFANQKLKNNNSLIQ